MNIEEAFFFSSKSYQPFFFPCVHNALRKYTHCSTVGRSVVFLVLWSALFSREKKGLPLRWEAKETLSLSPTPSLTAVVLEVCTRVVVFHFSLLPAPVFSLSLPLSIFVRNYFSRKATTTAATAAAQFKSVISTPNMELAL